MRRDEHEVGRAPRYVGDDDRDRSPAARHFSRQRDGNRPFRRSAGETFTIGFRDVDVGDFRQSTRALRSRRSPYRGDDVLVERVGGVDLKNGERASLLAGEHERLGVGDAADDWNPVADTGIECEALIDASRERWLEDELSSQSILRGRSGEGGRLSMDRSD